MKNFETISVLSVITGITLKRNATYKDVVEIITYVGSGDNPENYCAESFSLFWKLNGKTIVQEILSQHPELLHCQEESTKLKDVLIGEEWCDWAKDKIIKLGVTISLAPTKINIIQVGQPQFLGKN